MDGCAPARGRVPDINSQTPRRRLVLFWGVCRFYHISAIFRVFCLVILGNFVYLHTVKGVDANSHPELINSKEI